MSLPKYQRAWLVTRKDTPSKALALKLDVPVPNKLSKREVLVKIQAAALNPIGHKLMMNLPTFLGRRPYVAEHDFAGVIVDTKNAKFRAGDNVFGSILPFDSVRTRQGSLAEYLVVHTSNLALCPANVTPTQAAGLTLAGLTAYEALFDIGGLQEGQSIFVNGGSTAVGSFAIQMAKAKGCMVVASASAKNEAYVRSLGADEFIDYTAAPLHETLAASASTKFNVVFDTVGLSDPVLFVKSEAYLLPKGKFVSVDLGYSWRFFWNVFLKPTWLGGTKRAFRVVAVAHNQKHLEQIAIWVSEGKVKPLVDSVFAFEDVLQAYERIMTKRATGKVIIKVDPSVL